MSGNNWSFIQLNVNNTRSINKANTTLLLRTGFFLWIKILTYFFCVEPAAATMIQAILNQLRGEVFTLLLAIKEEVYALGADNSGCSTCRCTSSDEYAASVCATFFTSSRDLVSSSHPLTTCRLGPRSRLAYLTACSRSPWSTKYLQHTKLSNNESFI